MKAISIYATRAVAFTVVLFTSASPLRAADSAIPLIVIDTVPLVDAMRNLARQSGLNYVLDPRVPGSEFGPGRLAPQPSITARWTNVTARAALSMLLAEHKLTMVTNLATTVARIAPITLGVKPVPASQVGTNIGPVIPLMVMDSVPLTEAIRKVAGAAHINVLFDAQVSAPAFDRQGTVSFRWERLGPRQALVALLDNYGLVMSEDPATSIARIALRPKRAPERAESHFEPFPIVSPVADADPSVRHPVAVKVPTVMQVVRQGNSLTVSFPELQSTNLMVGHKTVTGMTREETIYRDGVARSRGMSLEGGLAFRCSTNVLTLGQDGLPQPGQEFTFEHRVTMFETDLPTQHMWSPQSGKHYRVLWTRAFRQKIQ